MVISKSVTPTSKVVAEIIGFQIRPLFFANISCIRSCINRERCMENVEKFFDNPEGRIYRKTIGITNFYFTIPYYFTINLIFS